MASNLRIKPDNTSKFSDSVSKQEMLVSRESSVEKELT
jgi:hypothetical protein